MRPSGSESAFKIAPLVDFVLDSERLRLSTNDCGLRARRLRLSGRSPGGQAVFAIAISRIYLATDTCRGNFKSILEYWVHFAVKLLNLTPDTRFDLRFGGSNNRYNNIVVAYKRMEEYHGLNEALSKGRAAAKCDGSLRSPRFSKLTAAWRSIQHRNTCLAKIAISLRKRSMSFLRSERSLFSIGYLDEIRSQKTDQTSMNVT